MKIILISNYPDLPQSMRRYADMLEHGLQSEGITVIRTAPPVVLGRLVRNFNGIGKWIAYIDKYLIYPILLKRILARETKDANDTLIHISDHSNAIYCPKNAKVPVVITCHDMIAIKCARGLVEGQSVSATGKVLQEWIFRGLNRGDRFLCISRKTQIDVQEIIPHKKQYVADVGLGLNREVKPVDTALSKELLRQIFSREVTDILCDRKYIFHVSSNAWYKNRPGVVELFAAWRKHYGHADAQLVLAGEPLTADMTTRIKQLGLESCVHLVVNCSDEQLDALYSMARVFVFPSHAEGFGWPIVEAQACGCPVLTTDAPPMNEVGGPAVELCPQVSDFDDVEAWAGKAADPLQTLWMEAESTREERILMARKHANTFQQKPMIQRIMAQYREALS